jgi:hypothetical protein
MFAAIYQFELRTFWTIKLRKFICLKLWWNFPDRRFRITTIEFLRRLAICWARIWWKFFIVNISVLFQINSQIFVAYEFWDHLSNAIRFTITTINWRFDILGRLDYCLDARLTDLFVLFSFLLTIIYFFKNSILILISECFVDCSCFFRICQYYFINEKLLYNIFVYRVLLKLKVIKTYWLTIIQFIIFMTVKFLIKWMLQNLLSCKSLRRIISEKLRHQVYSFFRCIRN